MSIYSVDGKLIRTIEKPFVDVDHLINTAGTYILEIDDGVSVSVEKILLRNKFRFIFDQ